MSLLTPERVPVKVYRWDDAGAPQLDKSPGCMMTIYKACLVTGYGDKEGAGWTMPFEDTTAKVKVFRPVLSPNTDFYLRCSSDDGKQMTSQVYLNMTAQNKGALKLQCGTPFKYAKGVSSGKWVLIASPRGVWFFCEQKYSNSDVNKTGAYFFCGDTTASNIGDKLVYLQHTGGSFDDGDFSNILSMRDGLFESDLPQAYLRAKVLNSQNVVSEKQLTCLANTVTANTSADYITPPVFFDNNKLYTLPGLFIPFSGAAYNNFTIKNISQSLLSDEAIVFGTGSNGSSNIYISINEWVY